MHSRSDSGPASIDTALSDFIQHRKLIYELTKREIVARYRGSMFGLAWSFFNPLLMLAVYTFVFSVIFEARWAGAGGTSDFSLLLFSGLIVHGIFAECVNRAPTLVTSNPSYVKKVVFPLDVLPYVSMGSALFHGVIAIMVLLAAQLFIKGALPWTAILVPFVLLPLAVMTVGMAWIAAALGVYIRDVVQVTGILTTVLLFLSPILYPISAVPESLRGWVRLNPLTYIVEQMRLVLNDGQVVDFHGLLSYTAVAVAVAACGYWLFQRLRPGFSDVM